MVIASLNGFQGIAGEFQAAGAPGQGNLRIDRCLPDLAADGVESELLPGGQARDTPADIP